MATIARSSSNNRNLPRSLAQANLPFYGIDFGNGLPNGRFTNGRTVSDIISDKIGLPRPLAFLDPSMNEDVILANGVNYASGGGGILNETGGYFIQKFSLWKQIELFQGTQDVLHSLGARKLMVFGLGPMGCIPLQRALSLDGKCQNKASSLAVRFNKAATTMLKDLETKLPNANYKFGEAYNLVNDVITNPQKYGFDNSDSPCCSFYRIRPALTCIPASTLCKDRSKYVFWDEYHPTDKANELVANILIKRFDFMRADDGTSEAPSPSPDLAPSPDDK
ncbi:hypothetical protein HID58_005954 [Brassica napus]|uniref:GDSL esterase/lipase n=1 Tax=Brassica napus TaxID=3708 RepID=A0ABQ8EAN1_BRANA|nr:hypothetical protein HID58_005954 [Brassica napus]